MASVAAEVPDVPDVNPADDLEALANFIDIIDPDPGPAASTLVENLGFEVKGSVDAFRLRLPDVQSLLDGHDPETDLPADIRSEIQAL